MDIKTKIRGHEAWVSVARGKEVVGTLTFNRKTICWIPEASNNPDESPKMTWVMPWEQFAAAMQPNDLADVGCLDQSVYIPANRASAPPAPANFGSSMPDAREMLGLRRRFNTAEFTLIRKGFPPDWDAKWGIYYDARRSELRMCRSWTGMCIYLLSFREDSHGAEIGESWVNRDPEQYEVTDARHDSEIAMWLIDVFLLARNREHPSKYHTLNWGRETAMYISEDTLREVEDALHEYEKEVHSSEMTDSTKRTYLLHTRNFVRWLQGEFVPGARKD